jgi:hypothetical protein
MELAMKDLLIALSVNWSGYCDVVGHTIVVCGLPVLAKVGR